MPSDLSPPPLPGFSDRLPSRFESIQGLRMHAWDAGEGEPVVMLHGNPTWCFLYWRLATALAARFRVLVPDHIGCGLSDRPGTEQYPFTLSRRISDLEAFLSLAGVAAPFHLVVHDWGGLIGLGLAVREPQWIRSLVVFNTAAFRVPPGATLHWALRWCRNSSLAAWAILRGGAFNRLAVRLGSSRGLSAEIRRGLLAPYRSCRDRLAVLRFVQDIPLEADHPSYPTLLQIEEGLTHLADKPVLVCWGERDFVFNVSFLLRWLHFFPHAHVHRIAQAGHYVMEDAAGTVRLLVEDFIKEH